MPYLPLPRYALLLGEEAPTTREIRKTLERLRAMDLDAAEETREKVRAKLREERERADGSTSA